MVSLFFQMKEGSTDSSTKVDKIKFANLVKRRAVYGDIVQSATEEVLLVVLIYGKLMHSLPLNK